MYRKYLSRNSVVNNQYRILLLCTGLSRANCLFSIEYYGTDKNNWAQLLIFEKALFFCVIKVFPYFETFKKIR